MLGITREFSGKLYELVSASHIEGDVCLHCALYKTRDYVGSGCFSLPCSSKDGIWKLSSDSESNDINILMGRTNPLGWKLESLLAQLVTEVGQKSDYIKDSEHPLKDMILENNGKIIELLSSAKCIQASTYEQLDALEPNKGPLNPRL